MTLLGVHARILQVFGRNLDDGELRILFDLRLGHDGGLCLHVLRAAPVDQNRAAAIGEHAGVFVGRDQRRGQNLGGNLARLAACTQFVDLCLDLAEDLVALLDQQHPLARRDLTDRYQGIARPGAPRRNCVGAIENRLGEDAKLFLIE